MNMWNRLALNARLGIIAGFVLIVVATIALGLWAYRTDYQVLFADLAPRDAAAMTTELERMKVPFRLADGGNTILVSKDDVYRTRLKLMGNDMPLHGAVGFEVFNNADFGMTEFVQKVNYQRAVQGELTRTILAIEDVQSARVHLALPEQGLFKKSATKPKASVTLAMKPGRTLAQNQVAGIQRLVAASVPDIVAADVTVLDQHGVALTRLASADGIESASTQLDAKRATEDYLMRKVTQVLDRTLGEGEAVASVDVILNLDQSKVTTEEVLPAKPGAADTAPSGVMVRERQTVKEGASTVAASPGDVTGRAASSGGTTSIESDYQVGRRVEQVVTASGAMKRMTVAVVVKHPLSDTQVQKLKDVVSLAVGFNAPRGDAVVVYSLDQVAAAALPQATAATDNATAAQALDTVASLAPADAGERAADRFKAWILVAAAAVFIAIAAAFMIGTRRRGSTKARLNQHERERLLASVHLWIQGAETVDAPRHAK